MSNQANNGIQQNFTTEKSLEHLPTEANASEQDIQEISEKQMEGVHGGFWLVAAPLAVVTAPKVVKGVGKLLRKIF